MLFGLNLVLSSSLPPFLPQILKDIRNRFEVLRGRQVHYIPGWDCHGLPIELKALGQEGGRGLSPLQLRHKGADVGSGRQGGGDTHTHTRDLTSCCLSLPSLVQPGPSPRRP